MLNPSGRGKENEAPQATPAQLRAQVMHVDLYLLQRLPVQGLQPDAFHQPLHSYSGDACIQGKIK